jgi:hypothetical protein
MITYEYKEEEKQTGTSLKSKYETKEKQIR